MTSVRLQPDPACVQSNAGSHRQHEDGRKCAAQPEGADGNAANDQKAEVLRTDHGMGKAGQQSF
jgi:hypothetical protein